VLMIRCGVIHKHIRGGIHVALELVYMLLDGGYLLMVCIPLYVSYEVRYTSIYGTRVGRGEVQKRDGVRSVR
jgi:hypothetical protein